MEEALKLVSTYGLAVVMCFLLIWLIQKISKDHSANIDRITSSYTHQIEELTRDYNEKVEGFTKAVNNNTKAMEEIINIALKKGVNGNG